VTRYQSWPGQSTSYMVGRLGILEARNYTKTNLGDKFNLKDFHFQVTDKNYIKHSYEFETLWYRTKKFTTSLVKPVVVLKTANNHILKRMNFTLLCRFCHKDRHPLLSSKITLRITSSASRNLTTMGVPIFWILLRELHPRIVIRNLECTSTLKPTGIMLKVSPFPFQPACLRTLSTKMMMNSKRQLKGHALKRLSL